MHAKHRIGPGNGYRSNALGMGGAAASPRMPPEGSMRGNRMYNSEYRNYNRDCGNGGQSKQFQPPLPPPRETDIFMEAGRMAAEYLVSKGVLPPIAIPGKWQNDGLKNQMGNFLGFRAHEAEKIQISPESRASAHSRLGNALLDVGPGRRRYSDEYNSTGSRNSIRGRKRTGSFKNYGSEVNREWGRSSSEKIRASPGMEADSDASGGHHDPQPACKDNNGGIQSSSPGELTQEVDSETHIESVLEKCSSMEDAGNNGGLSNEKCLPSDAGEPIKKSDDANKLNDETEVVKEEINDNGSQQNYDENKDATSSGMEDGSVSEDHFDLVKHCKFVNVPTRARSSLTVKSLKGDENPMNTDKNISERKHLEDSGVNAIDVDIDNSAANAASQNLEPKSIQSDVPTLQNEMDVTYSMPGQCSRSGSFPERSVYKEQQPDEGLSGFGSSSSSLKDRGEKRAIDFNIDGKGDFKKLRQWVSLPDAQADSSPPISCSMENQPTMQVQEPITSQSANLTPCSDENSLDISLFPKDLTDSCEFMEEKQLFPGSFKTCDLNLVGACDANENHDADPMLVFSSISQTGKAATPIDIDLSMSNNGNLPNKNGKHGGNSKDIEVIDLEKDSGHEDKTFGDAERRGDTVFTDLDGFPHNVHNANEIPDVLDSYGLMLSEFLGNDSPNCASVSTDLNSLHNHIGIPNAEGILGDDDSIYMSLGEIPISLLGAWEQPSQDYGKPF